MVAPIDDGLTHTFKSLPTNEEREFLEGFDSPEGGNKKQLVKIAEKLVRGSAE